MSHDVPLWLAIVVVAFLLCGSGLTLLGCIGLVRFSSFYDRLHMPTLGTSWGIGAILIASMLYASFQAGRLILHELLIGFFLFVTAPVTLMMLSQAAALRDNTKDWSQSAGSFLSKKPDKTGEE